MEKFKKSIIILAVVVVAGLFGFGNYTQALTLNQALAEIGTTGKINEAPSNIQELAATAYIKERINGVTKENALKALNKSIEYNKQTINGATIYKGRVGDTNYFKTTDSDWQYVANNPNMNFNEFKNDRYIPQSNSYVLKSIDVENNNIKPQNNPISQQANQTPGQTATGQQTPGQTISNQQQKSEQTGATTTGATTPGQTTAGGTTAGGTSNTTTTDCGTEGLAGQRFLFFHGPLVPCGVNKHCASDTGGSINKPCTICHFFVLIQNFFNLLLSLLIVVSIFMLTVAGVLYIISAGGKMATTAKEIIHKTLLGFGLFLLSWLIVFTLLKLLAVNTSMLGTGGDTGWFQFTCDDNSAFWINPGANPGTQPGAGANQGTQPGAGANPGTQPGTILTPANQTPVSPTNTTNNSVSSPHLTNQSEDVARANLWEDSGGHITTWESSPGATNIRNIRPTTRQGLLNFQEEFGGNVIVTGGAEADPHASGTYSHANGYKVDIDDTPAVNNYIENNYNFIGIRASRTGSRDRVYSDGHGNYYVREGNHWDVYYNTPAPPLSTL